TVFTPDLTTEGAVHDVGDVVLIPAMINAHTHLNLSDFARPSGIPGTPLHQWIPQLLATPHAENAVSVGLTELLTHDLPRPLLPLTTDTLRHRYAPSPDGRSTLPGTPELPVGRTIAVADFTQSINDARTIENGPIGGWTLRELIAPEPDRFERTLKLAEDFLTSAPLSPSDPPSDQSFRSPSTTSSDFPFHSSPVPSFHALSCPAFPVLRSRSRGPLVRGLAPHATYTVPTPILARIVGLAVRYRAPVAMHVAESPDEARFLDAQSGPLRSMLETLHVTDFSAFPSRVRFRDLLEILARAERALVVHGNFLDGESLRFLAEHRDRMAVVHCPRSFRHFGCEAPIVTGLRRTGVRFLLGTDGRSSSASLDLREEIAELLSVHPEISLREAMTMATLDAARTLGIDDWCGSLSPGRIAAFSSFPVTGHSVTIPSTGMIVPLR
ncbi:MAG: amidohydrolase family protein, partial [Planctomycetia bacterium]|nr:amidohydrolase family protein [Planctomycetia bacterium]